MILFLCNFFLLLSGLLSNKQFTVIKDSDLNKSYYVQKNINWFHPYYISVTEMEYNSKDKDIEIACKIFTDDFENTLKSVYQTKVDIYNPPDKGLLGKQMSGYINKHIQIKVDGKLVSMNYVGYEIESEAVWCYFTIPGINSVKTVDVFNNLLYDYKKEQINMMHVKVNGDRKSSRLSYPDTNSKFEF